LSGAIDIGIAVGAENMSRNGEIKADLDETLTSIPQIHDLTMPMGWTSENVAAEFNVTREEQDEYAAETWRRAEISQKAGWPVEEIVPITTQWKDPQTSEAKTVTVTKDEGIRYGTTKETLAKLRGAFPKWPPSTTTAGNASQLTDGAAALVLMKRKTAEKLGQPILGRFVTSTVVGLEPRIMGIGPAYAIPKVLSKVGLSKDEIDIFEINEAFASMAVYCVKELGLPREKVNPRGGAIAFGHPLGCTGTRQIVTALAELKRQGKQIAVTSMCVGTVSRHSSLLYSVPF